MNVEKKESFETALERLREAVSEILRDPYLFDGGHIDRAARRILDAVGAPAPTQPTPTYAEVLQALKAMYDGCPECGSAMCDHKGLSEVYSTALHVILEAERVGAPAPVQDSPTKREG